MDSFIEDQLKAYQIRNTLAPENFSLSTSKEELKRISKVLHGVLFHSIEVPSHQKRWVPELEKRLEKEGINHKLIRENESKLKDAHVLCTKLLKQKIEQERKPVDLSQETFRKWADEHEEWKRKREEADRTRDEFFQGSQEFFQEWKKKETERQEKLKKEREAQEACDRKYKEWTSKRDEKEREDAEVKEVLRKMREAQREREEARKEREEREADLKRGYFGENDKRRNAKREYWRPK